MTLIFVAVELVPLGFMAEHVGLIRSAQTEPLKSINQRESRMENKHKMQKHITKLPARSQHTELFIIALKLRHSI